MSLTKRKTFRRASNRYFHCKNIYVFESTISAAFYAAEMMDFGVVPVSHHPECSMLLLLIGTGLLMRSIKFHCHKHPTTVMSVN
jgi:hypothetical protein